MMDQGCVSALTGKVSNAIQMITTGLTAWRSTGATIRLPERLSCLASAYADLGHFDDAWRCVGEAMTAMEKANERCFEAEVHRLAGEIALKSPEPDATMKRTLSVRSPSPADKKPSHGNFALQ
jgi:predicted ATPase